MSTAVATFGRIAFMSPGDMDRKFWRTYHEDFLAILHRACDPVGYLRVLGRANLT